MIDVVLRSAHHLGWWDGLVAPCTLGAESPAKKVYIYVGGGRERERERENKTLSKMYYIGT